MFDVWACAEGGPQSLSVSRARSGEEARVSLASSFIAARHSALASLQFHLNFSILFHHAGIHAREVFHPDH